MFLQGSKGELLQLGIAGFQPVAIQAQEHHNGCNRGAMFLRSAINLKQGHPEYPDFRAALLYFYITCFTST
jgi:hypothetical protein